MITVDNLLLTPAMHEALARRIMRAIDAQRPDVTEAYLELVDAGTLRLNLRGDGRAVLVTIGGLPLCDATLDQLRNEAAVRPS